MATTTTATEGRGHLAAVLDLPAGLLVLVTLAGCADRAPPPLWPEPPPPTLAEPIGEPALQERPTPSVEPAQGEAVEPPASGEPTETGASAPRAQPTAPNR